MTATLTATDMRPGWPTLTITLLAEDSHAGAREARWTAYAMATAMGMMPDRITLESAEI